MPEEGTPECVVCGRRLLLQCLTCSRDIRQQQHARFRPAYAAGHWQEARDFERYAITLAPLCAIYEQYLTHETPVSTVISFAGL